LFAKLKPRHTRGRVFRRDADIIVSDTDVLVPEAFVFAPDANVWRRDTEGLSERDQIRRAGFRSNESFVSAKSENFQAIP
jgi:hypothetical protein